MGLPKGYKFAKPMTKQHKQNIRVSMKKAHIEGRITTTFKKGHKLGFKKGNKIGLKIGLASRFKEGNVPWNKDKKGLQQGWNKGKKLPPLSEEHKRKISLAWQNPEFVKKMFKAFAAKPNKAEKQLDVLIRSVTADFKYNGDFSQGITIGGRVPDFVNMNGRKQVIELFGDWFHSKEFAEHFNRTFVSVEDKIAHYKKFGFDCLVVWENELKNKETVLNKINNFIASNSKN